MKIIVRLKLYFTIVNLIATLMSVGQGVHMNTTYIMQINSEHHGMSYVNFFNTCTDNICMDNVKKLKPRVIRFPSAGDADCYTMNVDTAGYGIDFPDVAAYFADRFNSLQNPLTFTPFTNTYLCPLAIDPLQVPLHYNASVPAVFSNATDSANFCSELEDWYNDYRKQRTQITQSYLTKFIQHVKEIEDSLQPGERVNIIYVANIFSGTPADLVTTLKQLTDVQLNGIKSLNVVGVELSNESWGKANDDIFPNPNSGNQFYYYVRGMQSPTTYTGCLTVKGDFISAIRSNFPTIKIGYPTAPMLAATHTDYYGCSMSASNYFVSRYNAWNSQIATQMNSLITVLVNNVPITVSCGDAFVIHKYFDDKYWASPNEIQGNTCNNCLYNATGLKQYKNFLRDYVKNQTTFNKQYSFYPYQEDDTLKSSFDCQLAETFKYIDSGFVNKTLDGYRTQLGINNSNQKKMWMTEWNILENNNDDTTYLFHNTFNHAVLVMGWKMAMYRSNWMLPATNDMFQYSTFYNGVSENRNGIISKRDATGNFGDGTVQDAGSADVKRMAYWPTYLMRHISLDSLKWIDNSLTNFSTFPNTRFYTFLNQAQNYLYVFYINAGDLNINLNLDSVTLNGYNIDTVAMREYFGVKNNYSTAGLSMQFEQNKFYKTGNNWKVLLTNEPSENFMTAIDSSKMQLLVRKSMGLLKIPIQNITTGSNESYLAKNNFKIYPNPSTGKIRIQSKNGAVNGKIVVTNVTGSIVHSCIVAGTLTEVDLTYLSQGLYFIKIVGDNNIEFTYKMVIVN